MKAEETRQRQRDSSQKHNGASSGSGGGSAEGGEGGEGGEGDAADDGEDDEELSERSRVAQPAERLDMVREPQDPAKQGGTSASQTSARRLERSHNRLSRKLVRMPAPAFASATRAYLSVRAVHDPRCARRCVSLA